MRPKIVCNSQGVALQLRKDYLIKWALVLFFKPRPHFHLYRNGSK